MAQGMSISGLHEADSLKPKDLCLIPFRLALALQSAGWWVRSHIIWAKKSPMPESVTDRPTSAHESIFLLTRSAKYWYDADAVREPMLAESIHRLKLGLNANSPRDGFVASHAMNRDSAYEPNENGANLRNVWHLGPEPFSEAHFATFPTEIPRRCILAGCPKDGTVLDPFMGSGTTAKVAQELGRKWIGIELNPEYAEMVKDRAQQFGMAI
jgi:DNA modification methylase